MNSMPQIKVSHSRYVKVLLFVNTVYKSRFEKNTHTHNKQQTSQEKLDVYQQLYIILRLFYLLGY